MAEAAINLTAGQKADRKLDMIFVNVGGSGTETWELLGRGVEDASGIQPRHRHRDRHPGHYGRERERRKAGA